MPLRGLNMSALNSAKCARDVGESERRWRQRQRSVPHIMAH